MKIRIGQAVAVLLTALSVGHFAKAQSRCESGPSVRHCVDSVEKLETFQSANRQRLGSISVVNHFESMISHVNGKTLSGHVPFYGSMNLELDVNRRDLTLKVNGRSYPGSNVCFEACPVTKKITWYHPQYGEIQKIRRGLRIDGRNFLLAN